MNFAALSFSSPVGVLTLFEIGGNICALEWGRPPEDIPTPLLENAIIQLNDYFDGKRTSFDLPLAPAGTKFQQKIWQALLKIPYGGFLTYGDLAKSLVSSPRAIGMACSLNPIPILIPCHRVIAANGKLNGYSGEGGIETKANILKLEGLHIEEDKVIPIK